jgi:hypothetical protein
MPTSEARIAANHRNAQRSTGPRTPAGKRRSARNAVTHGILTHPFTLWEDEPARTAFDRRSEAPSMPPSSTNSIPSACSRASSSSAWRALLSAAYWRLRRLARAESLALAGLQVNSRRPIDVAHALPAADLELFMRYHVTIERQLDRALGELTRLQERRRAQETAQRSPSASPLRLLPRDRETLVHTDALKGEETWDDIIDELARELEAYCVPPNGADLAPFDPLLPNEPNPYPRAGPL